MTNSAKTPTGKAKKGQVTVRPDGSSIKACFPRSPFPGEKGQVKKATGISNVDGWEIKANQLKKRLQIDLDEGKLASPGGMFNLKRFNEILVEYKLRPDLKLVESVSTSDGQLPPKPALSLMEVWDMYCEYRKQGLRESHYENMYQGQFKNYLESAIEATKSEDALKIRNWLVENRNHQTVKQVLSNLSKAYRLGMKSKLLSHDPFEGMAEEIVGEGARGKTQNETEINSDDDIFDRTKAYTWDEVQIILDYVQVNCPHWYNFLKFKFLTGCRTGEAIAFMWCDIEWDKERILIRRTFNRLTKKFYPLKNDKTYKGEETRRFPMPKNGELWSLLKSIPQGELKEVVFKSKFGKIISDTNFGHQWRGRESSNPIKGIISTLIKKDKLIKYLPPYNTRHTFITHAVFDLGIDEKIVSKWCGHQIEVSNKHYQDVAIFAARTNPEVSATNTQQVQQQAELDLLREQLREQQELINKLLQNKDK
ncbi:MAG: site-specific integrase [Nostoc sp.]|uniref:tyrosine-type recombinase/integrase n=1 Tax=Nostoc sp. TaxID=1180 RepID=UPI002FFD4EEF